MEVAVLVGFHVWLISVAQTETSVLVHCRSGFANPLMTVAANSILHRRDAAELTNLLSDPLERTHDIRHRLDQSKKLQAMLLSFFKLGGLPSAAGMKEISKPMPILTQ
jgi:hypothetical protein